MANDYLVIRKNDELEVQIHTEANVKNLRIQHYLERRDYVVIREAENADEAREIGEKMFEQSSDELLDEPADDPEKHVAIKESGDVMIFAHTDELEARLDKEGWVRGMNFVVLQDMPDLRTAQEEARRQLGIHIDD